MCFKGILGEHFFVGKTTEKCGIWTTPVKSLRIGCVGALPGEGGVWVHVRVMAGTPGVVLDCACDCNMTKHPPTKGKWLHFTFTYCLPSQRPPKLLYSIWLCGVSNGRRYWNLPDTCVIYYLMVYWIIAPSQSWSGNYFHRKWKEFHLAGAMWFDFVF